MNPESYNFPSLADLLQPQPQAVPEQSEEDDSEQKEALRKGYEEGLEQGRAAAQAELQAIRAQAEQDGFEAGRARAAVEIERARAALADVLKHLKTQRLRAAEEIESFAVELALALAARLIEQDAPRAEFVKRMAAIGLKALAPEAPEAIYLSPADLALVGQGFGDLPVKADQTLKPGSVRVETAELFVPGGIGEAFGQIRAATMEVLERRQNRRRRTLG